MEENVVSTISNLRKRVIKLEREIAKVTRRKEMINCICLEVILTADPEEFEAAMNLPCPVHGVRRVQRRLILSLIRSDGSMTPESVKLHQLVDAYELRLSQSVKLNSEVQHDPKEC